MFYGLVRVWERSVARLLSAGVSSALSPGHTLVHFRVYYKRKCIGHIEDNAS